MENMSSKMDKALSVSTVVVHYFFFNFFDVTCVVFCIDIGLLVYDMQLYEETGNFNQQ